MAEINTLPSAQPPEPTTSAGGQDGFLNSTRKRAIGNGTGTFPTDGTPVRLPNIEPGVASAILVVEAAPGATAGAVLARFWSDGKWPAPLRGLPIYDGAVIELVGFDDVINTVLVSADGKAHKLNVQYFNA